MYNFISAKEAFYDDDKMMFCCHIGINDANMSLQYDAYERTAQGAIDKAASLAFLLNSVDSKLSQLAKEN